MLRQIRLVQPLAFARGGGSPTPCDAFDWAAADLRPHGTGRTRIVRADTLIVDPQSGEVSLKAPDASDIILKDEAGIRPVCPFFELHGEWDGGSGPVTPEILAMNGKAAADLKWSVEFCNAKAAHWSQAAGDRVVANVDLSGDDHAPKPLLGRAPNGSVQPLVPEGRTIPLGQVQLTCPNEAFPEFRLRFRPGAGLAYAPSNLMQRLSKLQKTIPGANAIPLLQDLVAHNARWEGFKLPEQQCMLNPLAAWPNYALFRVPEEIVPGLIRQLPTLARLLSLEQDLSELLRQLGGPGKDMRNLPPGLYANVTEVPNVLASLGMIDDYGDGIITCTLDGVAGAATARIVSGPPDFAPDRRPLVSLADGLADRGRRAEVRAEGWMSGGNAAEAEREIQDMLARAFETLGLANLDVLNDYFQTENANQTQRPGTPYTPKQARGKLWSGEKVDGIDPLPLTSVARDRHRRNTVSVFFRSFVQGHPDFVERYVREPAGPERVYDRKMPGLMRGGDRMPLHITRRQYDALKAWVDALQAGSAP